MVRQLQKTDLLVEQNWDGNFFYIKPNVGAFNARTASVDATIVNKHNQAAVWVTQSDHLIENLSVSNARQGISIRGGDDLRVYDYTFKNVSTSEVSGSAIYRNPGHTGSVEFLRVYADGGKTPINGIGGYTKNNTDFFDNNTHTSPSDEGAIFFRDVTAHSFGDAIFDSKSTIYIMNATIDSSFRLLRAHQGAEIVIVNSRIDTKGGSELAFLEGWDAKISYYNVLWNGKRTPDLSLVSVTGAPTHEREALKRANIIELDSNPLPSIDPFFRVDGDRYVAQVSVNGGSWIDVSMPSGGYLGRHIGDTLVELPKLGNGVYTVRAWTESNGQKSGAVTTETFTVKDAGFNYKGGGAVSGAKPGVSAPPPQETAPDTGPDTTGGDFSKGPAKDGRTVFSGTSGNDRIVGDKHANRIEGGAGDDRMTGGGGDDVYLFDNRKGFGADTITDFNFNRQLWFTEFVDLGADNLARIDKGGRFVVDGGGVVTIGYADRWMNYVGENSEGYHVYSLWKGAWPGVDILPKGGAPKAPSISAPTTPDKTTSSPSSSISSSASSSSDQTIVVRSGASVVEGGAGEDTISFSAAPKLAGGWSINLTKGAYDARGPLNGWDGKIANIEHVVGSSSNDAIFGTRGDNRIEGGAGNDHLIGGGGRDAFIFDNARSVGSDYVADFGRDDQVWLTQFVDLGPTRTARLDGGGGFWVDIAKGAGGEDRIDLNHDNALIRYVGQNGDGYFAYELA